MDYRPNMMALITSGCVPLQVVSFCCTPLCIWQVYR